LRQHKPSFGGRELLSGFTVKTFAEKAWTVIFTADRIAYTFVGVSISDAKFLGGEFLNELRNAI